MADSAAKATTKKVEFKEEKIDQEDSTWCEDERKNSQRLKSFAFVEGQEGKPINKDQYKGRCLGVFTSGGEFHMKATLNEKRF